MNFDDYIIDEEDYKFFNTLPNDEKLLFMYDLICENFYSSGSIELGHVDMEEPDIDDELDSKYHFIIAANINANVDVNILIINNKIILNSNSEELLNNTIKDLILDGLVLSKYTMSDRAVYIFQHQKYCKVYKLLGKEDGLCKN